MLLALRSSRVPPPPPRALHGMQAATGAGMRCMITYTSSTEDQDFHGAERVVFTVAEADPPITIKGLQYANAASDDRGSAKK